MSVIDTSTGTLARSISLGNGEGGNGIAYDPASDRDFDANYFTANVSRVGAASVADLAELPADWQPNGVAVDPATGIIYAVNFGRNTILNAGSRHGRAAGRGAGRRRSILHRARFAPRVASTRLIATVEA